MKKKIAFTLVTVFVVFLGYIAIKPSDYTVLRQITINAPADKIYPYLNSSRLGEQWGPWMEVDPQAKMVYSGPESGLGSKSSWNSGGQLGTGSATIVEVIPNQKVGIQLEYTKPMQMVQHSDYILQPSGNQTEVTWKVTGKNSFMGRLMCFFVNIDKVVGTMFEKGLHNLKTLVEKQENAK